MYRRIVTVAVLALAISGLVASLRAQQPASVSAEDVSRVSPFGVHDPGFPTPENDVRAIGAKWVRYAGGDGIVWDVIERQKGQFDWNHNDRLYQKTATMGVRMFVSTIAASRAYGVEPGHMPGDMSAYLSFLKKAVERYDGDGLDDAPGSPVIEVWQIENEPDIFWRDSPQDYARLLKESYKAVKAANPRAKVAMAGVGTPEGFNGRKDFYSRVFVELDRLRDNPQDRYFEVFDCHWYPFDCQYDYLIEPPEPVPGGRRIRLLDYVGEIRQTLKEHGYANVPVFITETAQYDGTPAPPQIPAPEVGDRLSVYHSETRQALFLLKVYVYALVTGVEKVFWVTLTEWHNFGGDQNGVFDHVGLVNNPANCGLSHKKLAYYTYRKMVAVLEGSDWDNIQVIQESAGVRVYKFTKGGMPIWVAWNDSSAERQIAIAGITSSRVRITEAVPRCESGKDVTDYGTAFRTETRTAGNGELSVTLRDRPVFVEQE